MDLQASEEADQKPVAAAAADGSSIYLM